MTEHNRELEFEKICRLYGKDLQRFIYTLTRKDQFAMEEIYQNTMLAAFKGLSKLRDLKKMKSWIFSIAKAEANRYYAANQALHYLEYREVTEEDFGIIAENGSDFTSAIANKDLVQIWINSRLSEEEQQICILHYYYNLTFKEISLLLHKNYNTIRSMHARGMAKIRKDLCHKEELK